MIILRNEGSRGAAKLDSLRRNAVLVEVTLGSKIGGKFGENGVTFGQT